MSWACADDFNDLSHLSISQIKCLLTLILTGEGITDPNYPYSFWVEMSLTWADDSNNVSHLSISQIKCLLTQILILGFYSNPSLMKKKYRPWCRNRERTALSAWTHGRNFTGNSKSELLTACEPFLNLCADLSFLTT